MPTFTPCVSINLPANFTALFVIPTDEEIVMTEDTYALLQGIYNVHTQFEYSFQKKSYVNLSRAEALEHEYKKNPKLKSIIARIP